MVVAPFYLTADLPGVGGRIREDLTDFVVEEIPLYEPCGVGEHCYLRIQKVGLSTHEAIARLARALRVPPNRIGYAGLKDARAVTRQTVSVSGVHPERAVDLDVPGVEVLAARRHRNKLRLGHLAGNRFLVRIRGVETDAPKQASAVLDRLVRQGAPNLFGPQRFGSKGDGHLVGRSLVRGDPEDAVDRLLSDRRGRERDPRLIEARSRYARGDHAGARVAFPEAYQTERKVLAALERGASPGAAAARIPKSVLRLLLSAYQSHLFNLLLLDRLAEGTLGTLRKGDLAWLHGRGAVFLVEEPGAEQPRADRLEISPSGPMYGRKVLLADGEPGERERALLRDEGLAPGDFRLPGLRLDGERRPFRVPVTDARARPDGEDAVLLAFALPKGSFATAVLREVMKVDDPGAEE